MNDVSVIVPTYNRAHMLESSIISVLEQTVPPDEIVIVDDYSTDNTLDVVKQLNSKRIKYMKNKLTKGANGARNTGILSTKSKYIAFQDSDDIWLPQKLEQQLAFMNRNPEYDMCFCSLKLITSTKKRIIPYRKVISEEISDQLRKSNFISTQTIFIKRSVALKYLFDESLKRFQDWDFVLKISKEHPIYHLNNPMVIAKVQVDSIGNTVNGLESLYSLFNKHPELKDPLKTSKSLINKVLFYEYYKNNKVIKSSYFFLNYLLNKILEDYIFTIEKL